MTCVGTYGSSGQSCSLQASDSDLHITTDLQDDNHSDWGRKPSYDCWWISRFRKKSKWTELSILSLFDSQRIALDAAVSQTKCSTDRGMTPAPRTHLMMSLRFYFLLFLPFPFKCTFKKSFYVNHHLLPPGGSVQSTSFFQLDCVLRDKSPWQVWAVATCWSCYGDLK